jgi:cell volume regulation protein A
VGATDPDQADLLNFAWTNSTACGTFTADGDTATWNHPQPPCPDETFHPGSVTVTISDGAGNEIVRVYSGGSAPGEGLVPTIEPPAEVSDITSSPEIILLAVGAIIFLSVGGEAFFKRTGIPDVAFLMILGVILGPILGIVTTAAVITVVPYFAALALIVIMFDGGINLNIRNVIRTAHFSLLLAVLGFFASMAVTAGIVVLALSWPLLDGLLLGAMVGGSSSIVVFGLVRRLKITDESKSMLSLESAVTDILATVVVFVLLEAILSGQIDSGIVATITARSVLTGLLLGFGVGIPWMYVYSKLSNAAHASMLTLGILFVLYFLARSLGESGALTALVFGLMLGNRQIFARRLRLKIDEVVSSDPFQERLTFLVRSFFFVFVGLLASFGQIEYVIAGIGIAVAIFVSRLGVVKISLSPGRFPAFDRLVTSFMLPRGLAAAVLATLPLTLGLPNANVYPQIVFVIILSTVVITTAGLVKYRNGADGSISSTETQVTKKPT